MGNLAYLYGFIDLHYDILGLNMEQFKFIFWVFYLTASMIAFTVIFVHIFRNKQIKIPLKSVAVILLIVLGFVGAYLFKQYKDRKPFYKITKIEVSKPLTPLVIIKEAMPVTRREPLPIDAESKIQAYLNTIDKNRPVIIGAPREIQIQFPDPLNPKSPHAVFQIVIENKGKQWAKDIAITWDIKDMGASGRRITPPDEWRNIIGKKKEVYMLGPKMGFIQIYGPEIGAYAEKNPPNIEVTIKVDYQDEGGNKYSYYCKSKTISETLEGRRYLFDIIDVK